MPTEHEYKYVLRLTPDLEGELKTFCREFIRQGYLQSGKGTATRVRNMCSKWFFTYKHFVNGRVVELEKVLSRRDGIDLWSKCKRKLEKLRYYVPHRHNLFELDFFRISETPNTHFMMCEVELKEGLPRPELPLFIGRHLLYEVPLGDSRFSNTQLWDTTYTAQLYRDLT